jgi:hypothetical protein
MRSQRPVGTERAHRRGWSEVALVPPGGPGLATARVFTDSTRNGAARVSDTTSDVTNYRGGELSPQRFVRPPQPAGPNTDESLQVVPVQINSRLALSRNRGIPPMVGG